MKTINIWACLFSPLCILNIFENRLYMTFGELPSLNIKIYALLYCYKGIPNIMELEPQQPLTEFLPVRFRAQHFPSSSCLPQLIPTASSSRSPCLPLHVGTPQCSTLRLLPFTLCILFLGSAIQSLVLSFHL